MSMKLTAAPRIYGAQVLECTVCKQSMNSQRALDDTMEARLFGSMNYAMCPCCKQKVPDGHNDSGYRARHRNWVRPFKIYAHVG